ncbi:MAG: putative CRISPR-associated protein [Thermodesulfovibrio sp.]|nr:putative CRISPR-associated protein [Thermodesulfovibrio sp.]
MKRIINMVGTSIFENYIKENNDRDFLRYYEGLKNKRVKDWEEEKERIKRLKNKISTWIEDKIKKAPEAVSAEIKSLTKLSKELDDDFEIFLLSSDTVLSKLAGEILKENLSKIKNFENKKVELKEIKGLQVWDRQEFNLGLSNLITEIYRIANEYWENIIINITGGYKATLPYLTILAQINRCPIYYVFENTDALIKIPQIPISINWSIFEKNEEFFFNLEKEGIEEIEDEKKIDPSIVSLLEVADNLYSLNPLGIALWERYKSEYDFIYVSHEIEEYLNKNPEKKKIFESSIFELKRRLRENPDNPDLNHILKGVNLPKGFKTFKHKEENLQVRILYRDDRYETRYGSEEILLYVGLIAIGSEVHNAESEYVEFFKRLGDRVINIEKYKFTKIKKGRYSDV